MWSSEAQATFEAILGLGLAGKLIDLLVGQPVDLLVRRVGGVPAFLCRPVRGLGGVHPGVVIDRGMGIPTVVSLALRDVRTRLPSIVIGPVRPGVRNSTRC